MRPEGTDSVEKQETEKNQTPEQVLRDKRNDTRLNKTSVVQK